jgi:hypothetical protein
MLVFRCKRFEGNCCRHLQGKNVGRPRKRVRDKRKEARTLAKIEITGAVKIRKIVKCKRNLKKRRTLVKQETQWKENKVNWK